MEIFQAFLIAVGLFSFPVSGQFCSGLNYFVRAGDNLHSLLNTFSYTGLTYASLVNANPTVNFNLANLASSYTIICIPLSNSGSVTLSSTTASTTTTARLSCQGLYYQVRSVDTTSSIVNAFSVFGVNQALLSLANPNINFNAANLTASYPGPLFICIPLSNVAISSTSSTTSTTTNTMTSTNIYSSYPYTACLRVSSVFLGENCNSIINRLGVTETTLNFCNGVPFCYNLMAGQIIRF
jgi:hypothetical protein